MRFEWDRLKDDENRSKHGVCFEETSTVFADPLAATIPDPDHSQTEMRFLTMGLSSTGRLVVVSHTEEEDDLFRIIAPARRHPMKEKRTKADDKQVKDTMRAEYDFSGAVRGKYHAKYVESTNVVVLDPDVAAAFKNAEAVNDALRALIRIARESGGLTSR